MDELSLYILDIAMNSVRAGASHIGIHIEESGEWLTLTIKDDGCGMSSEQVKKLSDPFFTTRKTRKVGLGIPFLTMLAEMTGGHVSVTSRLEMESSDHGTEVIATFGRYHIDFLPLGDITETVITLIQGSPRIAFVFTHKSETGTVSLDTEEIQSVLGDISLAEPDVLQWIRENLTEQYSKMQKKENK